MMRQGSRPAIFPVLLLCWFGSTCPCLAAPPDPAELATRIDKHVAARWAADKVTPANPADDAAFVRRVSLDLIGRIPTAAEARAFLDDKASDKRAKRADALLGSGAHARHWATFWRREWVPQSDTPQSTLGDELDDWLAGRLRDSTPYDRIVRDLLAVRQTRRYGAADGRAVPTTFLTASEFKPENLAANTSRAFLGLNLDCAQCHDHPFARWTREQFWQNAAFFARPPETAGTTPVRIELTIPHTKETVRPRLLTGDEPKWPASLTPETGRWILADWVTAKDNPYLARNAVNRVWANLFGTGLVEPLDDLSDQNPASHPKLLDELSKAFVESGFDLKYLIAAIVLSKPYQLSSVVPAGGSTSAQLFARSAVRGLTGEQLSDSLRVAAGLPPDRDDLDPAAAPRERQAFAQTFRVERVATAQRSILQSLSLMNGKLTAELADPARSPTLRAIADSPFLDAKGKVESLYLAAFARKPSPEELDPLAKYVETGGADGAEKKALADVLWALLNSSEFGTNH